jgi:ABC-2 type transport system permease protein
MGLILLAAAGPVMSLFIGDAETVKQGMEMAAAQSNMPFDIPTIPIGLIIAFLFYFLVGYFMYSTIFAAVGSAVDQESDAANLQQPIIFAIIIPMLFLAPITANPDSTLAVILSLIPFFTPILMTVRIAATDVPLWQIATSVVLTVGTVFLLIWIAAKIYRVGILMYGKKPKLKDLIKWVRLAK